MKTLEPGSLSKATPQLQGGGKIDKINRNSQQLRPQDHGDFFARVVATETQAEIVAGAGLPRAEHAGRGPDGRQVEVLRTEAHPDLVPQGVVDHGVTVLAGKDGKPGEGGLIKLEKSDKLFFSPPFQTNIGKFKAVEISSPHATRPQIHMGIPASALKPHQAPGGALTVIYCLLHPRNQGLSR